jgi:hypothetical protein
MHCIIREERKRGKENTGGAWMTRDWSNNSGVKVCKEPEVLNPEADWRGNDRYVVNTRPLA